MSGKKVFLYVLVSLFVVAILVGGGYALYHLGYTHGTNGVVFDRQWMHNFDRRAVPELWHNRGYVGFPFGFIPGILSGLVFLAVIALAIYGGIKLFFPGSRNRKQASADQPSQPAPPSEESTPEE
jgi:hypothetical protein